MKLTSVYIRFYRSFNFDYLRKSRDTAVPDPWDLLGEDELFFPFVRVPVESGVTTVVGANEAGKSQLLNCIESLLHGSKSLRRDFCRYSTVFAEEGSPDLPEFGGEFSNLSEAEIAVLRDLFGDEIDDVSSFHLFRFYDRLTLYLNGTELEVDELPVQLRLPIPFRIESNIPLPDSVEIAYLASPEKEYNVTRTRRGWLSRIRFVREHPESVELQPEGVARPAYDGEDERPKDSLLYQWQLARRLLVDVAGITPGEFGELRDAVHHSDGYAEALVDKMNRKLSDSLNFRRWWSQDSDFALRLRLRDFDLVFTIRDRTGSDYTFRERSQGLRFFLSYFVQYLSHEADHGDVLLMDEPDAFLSNSGQQDLLRIFDAFAHPLSDEQGPVQVLYVTHSPFLIDKNHAERIRVLEKGDGEEGTRVVNNAGRNHYEPLRSALGSFVAETTFISSCNLMLEGQADPILLAGASTIARRVAPEGNALDLNSLTLVPCGGARNVPYMVHLARGRDEDKPAVLVLVDKDPEGLKALDDISAMKGLIDRSLIFTVASTVEGSDRSGITELEDLVPVAVANQAVLRIARTVFPADEAEAFLNAWVDAEPKRNSRIFKAIETAATVASQKAHLQRELKVEKVAFARSVMDICLDPAADPGVQRQVYDNFQPVLALIESKQREALRQHANTKVSSILNRLRKGFISDHPSGFFKTDVATLLENIQAQLPRDAAESDSILDGIRKLQREFALSDNPRELVSNPELLRERLYRLSYEATNAVQNP